MTNPIIATEDPAKDIGKILKKIRFDRELTLDNVSMLTGVSKTMLGQIERGVSVPTISVLWKIAKGLQISLSSLLNEPTQQYQAVQILTDIQPVCDEDNKMLLYNIFPFNPLSGFEYFYIILKPGASHHSDAHRSATEEYVIVTEGTLTLQVEEQTFTLQAPAKINFRANVAHSYTNQTDKPVIFQNIMKY
ncbi:XRE family transcriptional regulator [uncultured Megasphaera sp.]|uniref:helix-turn-helix domain-containing protein n=1 Tax=uncultured Megasphaera sp. TaxID=165188 RepID=UPI0026580005|nr:XRE family transcriptional regulator [uncultured Megasphaera sp.]